MKRRWPALLLALPLALLSTFHEAPAARPHCGFLDAPSPADDEENVVDPVILATAPPAVAPVVPGAREAALRRLLGLQNPDGSWGDGQAWIDGKPVGAAGVTSLALAALYSQNLRASSHDIPGSFDPGLAISSALIWLHAQRDDLMTPLDRALASIAGGYAFDMMPEELQVGVTRETIEEYFDHGLPGPRGLAPCTIEDLRKVLALPPRPPDEDLGRDSASRRAIADSFILIHWGTTGPGEPVPASSSGTFDGVPDPDLRVPPDRAAEQECDGWFFMAQCHARAGRLDEALALLYKIRNEYAATRFYEENRDEIARLIDEVKTERSR